MSGFIEQFYYGNIEPQARGISTNKTMAKELGVLNDAEEYLTSKLSGEEKKKLTVPDLLAMFSRASGSDEANDKMLLS